MTNQEALKNYFGIEEFRDKQEETIESLRAGKNTLTLMPTGMGKSLIFQMTAILEDKMALIVSPLLALMDQQTDILNNTLSSKG